MFHNLKGFDGVFILKELYRDSRKVVNQACMGAKVLTFKTGSITFKRAPLLQRGCHRGSVQKQGGSPMVRSLDETEQQTAWEEPQLIHQVRHWTKKVRQPIDIDNTRWDIPPSITNLKTRTWTSFWIPWPGN